jgi:hypothetical protein
MCTDLTANPAGNHEQSDAAVHRQSPEKFTSQLAAIAAQLPPASTPDEFWPSLSLQASGSRSSQCPDSPLLGSGTRLEPATCPRSQRGPF